MGSQYATSGAWIAFHASDHGLVAIQKKGIGMAPGTIAKLGLERKMVIMHVHSGTNTSYLNTSSTWLLSAKWGLGRG